MPTLRWNAFLAADRRLARSSWRRYAALTTSRREEIMTADNCVKARTVHELLSSAHPHRTDENLKKAADLLLGDGDFQERKPVFLAVQMAMAAIDNGVSAAEGERLQIQA